MGNKTNQGNIPTLSQCLISSLGLLKIFKQLAGARDVHEITCNSGQPFRFYLYLQRTSPYGQVHYSTITERMTFNRWCDRKHLGRENLSFFHLKENKVEKLTPSVDQTFNVQAQSLDQRGPARTHIPEILAVA